MTVEDFGVVDIQNTAPLEVLSGGVWEIHLTDQSRLNMSGGEVAIFDMSSESTAILSGGRIDNIGSWQIAWEYEGQPAELVWVPHIEMLVKDYTYNALTKVLKGTWGDDSSFRIQLIDRTQYGYSPAIDNIKFTIIPEPMSLMLLALGGLLIRWR